MICLDFPVTSDASALSGCSARRICEGKFSVARLRWSLFGNDRSEAESDQRIAADAAIHAFELPSVFDCDRTVPFIAFQFEGESGELVDAQTREIHGDWVRFVKMGAPDPDNWPQYEGYDSEIRVFDREMRTESAGCRALMELWGNLRFYEG